MAKKNQKSSIGCRVSNSLVLEVDEAAVDIGITRAEWIENAIKKALGKRPRVTMVSRVAKLEKQMAELMGSID